MVLPLPNLDDHTYADLVEEARSQIPIEYPGWTDHNPSDTGIILLELFAWLTEMVLYRVNQVPDANLQTFLQLLNGPNLQALHGDQWQSTVDLQTAIQQTIGELRRRYRAVNCEDFEQLTLQDWNITQTLGAANRVIRAKCLPQRNLEAPDVTKRNEPAVGHMSLITVPQIPSLPYDFVLSFDGRDDLLSIPLNEPETEVTHEFWFKTSAPNCGLFAVVAGNLGAGGHDRHLYLSGGNIKARIWDNETISSTNLNLADNTWHQVAHVFGASVGGQKIYIDGELVASGSKAASNFSNQTTVLVGYSNDASAQNRYCKGHITELRIWNQARTQAAIQADRLRRLTGQEPGLLGYWAMNEGTGAIAYDQTSLKNHGTITGDTIWNATAISSQFLRSQPDFQRDLWSYLDARRLLTTRHHVVSPAYVLVTLQATLHLEEGAKPEAVQQEAIQRVTAFFHPTSSKTESVAFWQGKGWIFGRDVYVTELYQVLDQIPGVDYVEQVVLDTPDATRKQREGDRTVALTLAEHELVAVKVDANSFDIRETQSNG
jgi:hypothetical protein